MAEETQYTARTYIINLTGGQAHPDGTGSTTVFTAASNGTLIKKVYFKGAASNLKRNMVRLFVDDSNGKTCLLHETDILPQTAAAINPTFEASISLNFVLKSGYKLKASIDQDFATGLNIIAETLDFAYYSAAVRADTTQFTANTGVMNDNTANPTLTGTSGTIPVVYSAGTSGTYKGSSIETITVKASVTNTPGMVRLFIYNTTNSYLFTEIPIPSVVPDATDTSFEHTIVFENNFDLQAGYSLKVTTEKGENFNIIVEGKDWNYVS